MTLNMHTIANKIQIYVSNELYMRQSESLHAFNIIKNKLVISIAFQYTYFL